MVSKSYVGKTDQQIEEIRRKKREAMRGKYKRVSELTPEQLEKRRAKLREYARRRRADPIRNGKMLAKRRAQYAADPEPFKASARTYWHKTEGNGTLYREPRTLREWRNRLTRWTRVRRKYRIASMDAAHSVFEYASAADAYEQWFESLDEPVISSHSNFVQM